MLQKFNEAQSTQLIDKHIDHLIGKLYTVDGTERLEEIQLIRKDRKVLLTLFKWEIILAMQFNKVDFTAVIDTAHLKILSGIVANDWLYCGKDKFPVGTLYQIYKNVYARSIINFRGEFVRGWVKQRLDGVLSLDMQENAYGFAEALLWLGYQDELLIEDEE